jgi:Mitochondrial biogenesis AIM24
VQIQIQMQKVKSALSTFYSYYFVQLYFNSNLPPSTTSTLEHSPNVAMSFGRALQRKMARSGTLHYSVWRLPAFSSPPVRSSALFHHIQKCSSSTSSELSASSISSPTVTSSNALGKISSDGVVGIPIDFDVASKIEGNESQIVTITLEPGQVLRAESGAMMYMTDGVQMETTTGGGLSAGFSRMLTGQNFFISDYRYTGDTTGTVALGTDFPSKIVRLNVEEYGGKLICQKGALLCASHTIDITMEYSKNLTTGFFGGEGFILQVSGYSRFLQEYPVTH